jgi:hypothetical protein
MLQDEINGLQVSLAEELVAESQESDPAEQLALQSTLTVLAERMSTIRMKAAGKRQLLEVNGALEGFQVPLLNQALASVSSSGYQCEPHGFCC